LTPLRYGPARRCDAPIFRRAGGQGQACGQLPDGIASFKQSPDLVEDLLPASLAFAAYQVCLSGRFRTTIQACRKRRQHLNPVAADPRIPDRRLIAAKLALDGFTEVLHQMEPIGDLPGLWRALTRGLRIEPCTVAADDVNVGMIFEPITLLVSAPPAPEAGVDNDRRSLRG
jgi:hypothetical protein